MITAQQSDFLERIERIAAGQGTTKTTVFVGQDQTFTYVPKNRQRHGLDLTGLKHGLSHALAVPAAFVLGFLGNGFERYAQWVLEGFPVAGQNADVVLVRSVLLASAIGIIACYLSGLRGGRFNLAVVAGAFAGVLLFHNLVHLYPHTFELLFSPLWTARTIAETEPMSLFVRGSSFTF